MRDLEKITLRWLGVAGIDLGCPGWRIIFDPYLSRVPLWKMLSGRISPDAGLICSHLPRADSIFITHSHFDHLLDASEAAHQTGAVVHGSPNTCRILRAEGLPKNQIVELHPGSVVDRGGVRVTALAERPHQWVAGFGMQTLKHDLKPPLRARDYAMDFGLSFLVECAGVRLMTETCLEPSGVGQIDVLLTSPLNPVANDRAYLQKMIDAYRPRVLIPIHCDDMNTPLSSPARGQLAPTGRVWPPLARFDGSRFKRLIESMPGAPSVFLPQRLREYTLAEILPKK
jgi:L-ascorbate metabolism protein UlaG (beta-lactamase superfamily)